MESEGASRATSGETNRSPSGNMKRMRGYPDERKKGSGSRAFLIWSKIAGSIRKESEEKPSVRFGHQVGLEFLLNRQIRK